MLTVRRLLGALLWLQVLSIGVASSHSVNRTGSDIGAQIQNLRDKLVSDPQTVLTQSVALEKEVRRVGSGQHEVLATILWLQADANVRLRRNGAARERIEAGINELNSIAPKSTIFGDLLRTRGDINCDEGDLAAGVADYQAAYRNYIANGDRRSQALALIRLASLYREGADYGAALKYFGQATDAYRDDPLLTVSLFNNRGNVLAEMKRFEEARVEFTRALELVRRVKFGSAEATILNNLARVEIAIGAFDSASKNIDSALLFDQQSSTRTVRPFLVAMQGRIALEQGYTAKAVRLIDQVFAGVDLEKTSLSERNNHLNAYLVYKAAGETSQALAHLEALERLDEQAAQIATSTKTALMAARFDFQNQELRIARLKQDELRRNIAFERSQVRLQRILFFGFAATVAVVVGLLTFGMVTLRRSRNEVRDANIELATTNAALESALKAKTDFLATTSHEIRTPLNGILGMTQVMLADPALAPGTRERLGIVQGAGVTMRALVDDILDVAKMETGNLIIEPMPINVRTTIADVARMWRAQAEDRGIRFVLDMTDTPEWIESDPVRLRQIVFNLLSNALKFTHAGEVAVRLSTPDGRLHIAVSDTGVGIPEDKLESVFESFRQADTSTTRQFGGTGLGLTICRNLAEAMGGDIRLESSEGRGSTFTVDLPLVLAAAPTAEEAHCADPEQCELAILERNPIARGMMRALFDRRVSVVHFVDNVEGLLAIIGGGHVGAVLVEESALRAACEDPVTALKGLGAALNRAGARGVVLAGSDHTELRSGTGAGTPLSLLAKPVSGAQLAAALLDPGFNDRTGQTALVSRAA